MAAPCGGRGEEGLHDLVRAPPAEPAAETYLAPAPLEPPERAQEYLLRSMSRFRALSAWIGLEAAFYLGTDTLVEDVSEERLDRVLGSIYEATEALFVPLMRLGYGDRFKP
ncbi:MAG: hypothetical protein R2789_18500 [Microthrixaceae bacterium]